VLVHLDSRVCEHHCLLLERLRIPVDEFEADLAVADHELLDEADARPLLG
jgi:hypothetical protein